MSLKRNPSRTVVNFSAGPSALPYEVFGRFHNISCLYILEMKLVVSIGTRNCAKGIN